MTEDLSLVDELNLPCGWASINLGTLRQNQSRTFNPGTALDTQYELYSVPSHQTGRPEFVSPSTIGSNKQFVSSGDVLISKINPRLNRTWVVAARTTFTQIASTEWIVFPKMKEVHPRLLGYYLRDIRIRDYLTHNASGVGGSLTRVRPDIFDGILLALPPLNEQYRIVEKIEELFSELDASVESLTLARAQLKTYRQALLKAAFEGKLTADWRKCEMAWDKTRLGDEIIFLTSGSRGWADYYATQGDIFIRAQNLKFDRLDLSEIAYVQLPAGTSEGRRTQVQSGDVLITITGANVTKTGIVTRDLATAYVSQHVALCRLRPTLRPEFLYWYLLSETSGRRQLNDAAYGAGKPGLNLENIRDVTLRLPPISEQDIIVSRINSFLSIEENMSKIIDTEVKRISSLRQSILKKAFSGQLVPQDPADEPASVLLARINAEQIPAPKNTKRRVKNA